MICQISAVSLAVEIFWRFSHVANLSGAGELGPRKSSQAMMALVCPRPRV